MIGASIIEAIDKIRAEGIEVSLRETKEGKIYTFGNDTYSVEVKVEEKWLGLEFNIRKLNLEYFVDTDAYDITREDNKKFAKTIETDISDFLNSLQTETISVAISKPLLAIPTREGTDIVTPATRTSHSKPLEQLKEAGGYEFYPFGLHGFRTTGKTR